MMVEDENNSSTQKHIQTTGVYHPADLIWIYSTTRPQLPHSPNGHLVILLSFSSLGRQVPPVNTVFIALVFNSNLSEMGKDVLHLGIGIGSLRTSQVVQPRDLVKQVVNDRNNNGNTNGVSPDNNNSDNRSV